MLKSRKKSLSAERKATQLTCFDTYMRQFNRPYRATVQDMAGWIGWLHESRVKQTGASISWKSLAGYISGVRTSLVSLGHSRIQDRTQSLLLDEVCKAYKQLDEESGQHRPVRIGISSSSFRRILESGLESTDFTTVRHCAMAIFARVHGLGHALLRARYGLVSLSPKMTLDGRL